MPNEIDDIEREIDQIWDNLRIYKLPLYLAIFTVLATFEDYISKLLTDDSSIENKRDSRAGITRLRQSLGTLIPKLNSKCADVWIKKSEIMDIRNTSTPFDYASEAINFSQKYDWFVYHMTAHRRGLLDCEIDGRVITFKYKKEQNLTKSLMHHSISRYHEEKNTDANAIENIKIESPPQDMLHRLNIAVKHVGADKFISSIPEEVFAAMKKIVLAGTFRPTIGEDTTFGRYTVGEFFNVWINFCALMVSYLQACRLKYQRNPEYLKKSRVVIIEPNELTEILSNKSDVPLETSIAIINGLVLNKNVKKPDIQIQQIFEINPKIVFLSPFLVFTSNWEVCLLRKWAKYPGLYGKVVASKKDKIIDELFTVVSDGKVNISKRKKLFVDKSEIGEVDFAIFDRSNGCLIISEVKWPIEPDSFQEESHTKDELKKGIEQLQKYKGWASNNLDWLLRNIFDDNIVRMTDIKEIKYILLSKGSIDSGTDIDSLGLRIFDHDIFVDIFKENIGLAFRDKLRRVIDFHERLENEVKAELSFVNLKFAGYILRTPSLKIPSSRLKINREKPDLVNPRIPCPCGSGRMFRDCCEAVVTYSEDSELEL